MPGVFWVDLDGQPLVVGEVPNGEAYSVSGSCVGDVNGEVPRHEMAGG